METIHEETKFDILTTLLQDKDVISHVHSKYPQYNPRVLLSSVVLYRFPTELHVHTTLSELAIMIWTSIFQNQDIPSQLYDEYFTEFNRWRTLDINHLKHEIESGKALLDSMKTEEGDEADKQWNDGINLNIEVMEDCEDKLDILSQSPPSKFTTFHN